MCILRWKAPDFNETRITAINLLEDHGTSKDKDKNEAFMIISTKNNQIFVVNLTKQVYFPEHLNLKKEMKETEMSDQEGSEVESSGDQMSDEDLAQKAVRSIRSVGFDDDNDLELDMNYKQLSNIEKKKVQI